MPTNNHQVPLKSQDELQRLGGFRENSTSERVARGRGEGSGGSSQAVTITINFPGAPLTSGPLWVGRLACPHNSSEGTLGCDFSN